MAAHALSPATEMTEAEYLSLEFEISPDLVDGQLEERNLGEIEHTNWQVALVRWFLSHTEFFPATEVHIRVAPGRFRVADIAIFRRLPQGRYVTEAPLAVIEILSPTDSYQRLKGRMRDYREMGVRNLFVVESRTEFSEFRENSFVPVQGGRSLLEGSDIVVDWTEAAKLLWPSTAVEDVRE